MRRWFCLILFATSAFGLERQSVSLAGPWQRVAVTSLDDPLPADGWREVTIPSEQSGYDYGAAWFRRSFDVPAAWQGRRIVLRFGGVKWNSRALVNGQRVGGCLNGQDAFTCDITATARPGTNELLVGATDWTGVFDPAAERMVWNRNAEIRHQPKDRILAPIGGHVTTFGIWDDVLLQATAPVHASYVAIRPSVRQQRLTVLATVANPNGRAMQVDVTANVSQNRSSAPVLSLPVQHVTVPPDGEATIELTAPWTDARPWSFEDPWLYDLHLTVQPAAGDGDEQSIRFGFRELWCDGPDCYLNGHKIHMLASSWWPQTAYEPIADVRAKLKALKDVHVMAFRTHTQPWREQWYTVADELGMLMIPEGAVWNDDDIYKLDDDRFWDNYREHLQNMVRNLGNHASVVMWSLENEFYGSRINNQTPEREARLAALADAVREVDPTRPITYESDGDPGGKADVIGIHYPNEWPREYQWPNCADWIDDPKPNTGGGGAFWPEPQFRWPRNKPLYIGEFLWIPSNNPDASTIFYGDESYSSYQAMKVKAKAQSWYWQILAYRREEVSGISPWTVVEGGPLDDSNPCYVAHRRAYEPVAAFPREFDSRFFEGETITRTFDVYNDSLRPVVCWLAVGWDEPPGELPRNGIMTHPRNPVLPGGHVTLTAKLPVPSAASRLCWQVGATHDFNTDVVGRRFIACEDSYGVHIAERSPLMVPATDIGLYDPTATAQALTGLAAVKSLDGPLPNLLVIAPEAISGGDSDPVPVIGGSGSVGDRLAKHVEQGGKLLVFSQSNLPKGLFGLSALTRNSTLAFAGVDHTVTAGLSDDAFQLWRGDHFVTRMEIRRPSQGGTVPIVVTGGATGLDQAAVLEVRAGAGSAIFCGLRIPEKLATEPMAAEVLNRMVAYLSAYQAKPARTALDCADPLARQVLDGMGLQAEDATDPNGYDVAILHQPKDMAARAAGLRSFVEGGGKLLLSQVAPEDSDALAAIGLDGIRLQASSAPVTLAEQRGAPLAGDLLREDLYWLGPQNPAASSWSPLPRAASQALAVVSPTLDPAQATVYECEAMETAGTIVMKQADHVAMATAGTATGTIRVPADGEYVLAVRGWGSPAQGIWPLIQLSVDGRAVGAVQLEGRESGVFGTAAELMAGERQVELRFVNDQQIDNEDRNAYLDALLLAPAAIKLAGTALTSPPAIIVREIGQGLVVLDEVRWHDAPGNTEKARRHLASVLTALGAACKAASGTTVEAESFTIQPGLTWNRAQGGFQTMAQGGWFEGPIRVATAGRYRLTVTARGTIAGDGWPHATLTLNGQKLGEVTVTGTGWDDYPLDVDVPAGEHVLRLEFDNDLNVDGQDRNLYVDRFRFEAR